MQYVGGFLYIGVRAKASYLCSHIPSLPATSTADEMPSVSFTLSVSIKEKARCKKASNSLATDGSPGGDSVGAGERVLCVEYRCFESVTNSSTMSPQQALLQADRRWERRAGKGEKHTGRNGSNKSLKSHMSALLEKQQQQQAAAQQPPLPEDAHAEKAGHGHGGGQAQGGEHPHTHTHTHTAPRVMKERLTREQLESMSCEEVGEWLRLLGMSAETLQVVAREQLPGMQLADMSVDEMMADLAMSRLQAKRLVLYADLP